MALWGLFIKFTLLHQDSVFRAFSETRKSPESILEKAYVYPPPHRPHRKLGVKVL